MVGATREAVTGDGTAAVVSARCGSTAGAGAVQRRGEGMVRKSAVRCRCRGCNLLSLCTTSLLSGALRDCMTVGDATSPDDGSERTARRGREWEHQEAEDAGGAPLVPRHGYSHLFFLNVKTQ